MIRLENSHGIYYIENDDYTDFTFFLIVNSKNMHTYLDWNALLSWKHHAIIFHRTRYKMFIQGE